MIKPQQPTSYILKWMRERKKELEKEVKAKKDATSSKMAN